MKLPVLLTAFAATIVAQNTMEPRVVSETLPAGGLMQIKLMLTAPRPIIVGSTGFDMDASFDSLEGVSLFSPNGDGYGVAWRQGRRFQARIVSPQASLGTQLDYPFLVAAANIRGGLPAGTRIPIAFDTASAFQGPAGAYTVLPPAPGELTIGGSISINNVIPGGGLLPAGATVRILGTGFTPQTRFSLNEIVPANTQFVSANEIDVTLASPAQMTGVRIRARNNVDNHQVTYYSYLRPIAMGASGRPLLVSAHPLFPAQTVTAAGLTLPAAPVNGFIGFALLNPGVTTNTVALQLRSAAGAVLASSTLNMNAAALYMRTAQEAFGVAALAGSVVQVTSSAPLHVLGLSGDEGTGILTAFLPGAAPPPPAAQLTAAPASLSFTYQRGGAVPAPQMVNLGSSGAALSFTASSDAAWLSVTPVNGLTPAALSVAVSPVNLAPGTYSGNVSIASTSGPPVSLPVSLTVTQPAGQLTVSVASAAFRFTQGGAAPAPQAVSLGSTGASLNFTASSNASWLAVTPANGATPATLNLAVSPVGLAPGLYNATITIAASGAANVVIPVSLEISAAPVAPQLSASPNALQFTATGTNPAPQSLTVSGLGGALNFTATANTAWLSVSPSGGQTPTALAVSVNAAGLAPGQYTGQIVLAAPGATPVTVPVALSVSGAGAPQLIVPATQLVFSSTNGSIPPAQSVTLSSSGTPLAFTAASNAGWLAVSPISGTTPASLNVSANPAGLTAGTYSGTVSLTAPGSNPVSIAVSLNVSTNAASQLSVSPAAVALSGVVDGPALARTLTVAASGSALNFSVTTNQSWLTVAPSSGTTPASVVISASTSLLPGTYSGMVTFTAAGSAPVGVPVSLTLSPAGVPRLSVTPPEVQLSFVPGGAAPAPQVFSVSSTMPVAFTAATNAPWLTAAPASGQTPAAVNALVNPVGLAEGSYTATVTITPAQGAAVSATVTLRVGPAAPAPPAIAAVVNAASQRATAQLAAGELITIYGSGLGPAVPYFFAVTAAGRIDTAAAPVQVLIGGLMAPVLYASATQINAVVPFELPATPVDVQVEYLGQRSPPRALDTALAQPALFTQDGSGRGASAALNEDNTLNTPARPARRGGVIVLYGTGGGLTSPASATAEVTGPVLKTMVAPVTVRFGTRRVTPVFAGAAPGFVAGVLQVNVVVPLDLAPGAVEVAIESGSPATVSSPPGPLVFID